MISVISSRSSENSLKPRTAHREPRNGRLQFPRGRADRGARNEVPNHPETARSLAPGSAIASDPYSACQFRNRREIYSDLINRLTGCSAYA
jgi:hypothetical protein